MDLWAKDSEKLGHAYVAHAGGVLGGVRFEVVTRELQRLATPGRLDILDVGGGYGEQALRLARLGHRVTIVDPDRSMLRIAMERVASDLDGEARVQVVEADGREDCGLPVKSFDMVLLHSVLMYFDEFDGFVEQARRLLRPGGFASVLSLNPASVAFRSGLQQRWSEALASLRAESELGERYLPVYPHTREAVTSAFEEKGFTTLGWTGVRIFSDHLQSDEEVSLCGGGVHELYDLEWAASRMDPYRQVARLFHVVFQRC